MSSFSIKGKRSVRTTKRKRKREDFTMDLEQWLQSVQDAEKSNALPFVVEENRVKVSKNSAQIKKWQLFMTMMTIYIGFVLVKGLWLYHHMHNDGTTPFKQILDFNLCVTVGFTAAAEMLLHVLTVLGMYEIPAVVNSFINYVEHISGNCQIASVYFSNKFITHAHLLILFLSTVTFPSYAADDFFTDRIRTFGVMKELQLSKHTRLSLTLMVKTGRVLPILTAVMAVLNPAVAPSPASHFLTSSPTVRLVTSILSAIFYYLIVSKSWESAKFYILATLYIPVVLGRIHGQLL